LVQEREIDYGETCGKPHHNEGQVCGKFLSEKGSIDLFDQCILRQRNHHLLKKYHCDQLDTRYRMARLAAFQHLYWDSFLLSEIV
jgi:hypothetical protein